MRAQPTRADVATQHVVMSRALDAKIWAIAWPAIVSNISIPLLGLVDASLLGHLDTSHHLAAVAVGGAIMSFLYWGFSFLRMGTTGEVARACGAGNKTRAVLALGRAAVLALTLAALLLVLRDPLLTLGLQIMDPQPELRSTAYSYSAIRLWSAPAVLLTYTLVGWFIGHQNTRWPMVIVIITNVLNIALDALFILGLNMASAGAALATVIAEYAGLLVAVFALRRHYTASLDGEFWAALSRLRPYLALIQANLHLFFRSLTLLFVFAFFTAAGEKLGADVVAANAIMMQFLMFASFALDGFAYAAEGLAGEALGGGDTRRFFVVCRRCTLWTVVSALLISLLIFAGRGVLFPLLTDLPTVLKVMRDQGLWLALLPVVGAPSYLLDGIFIGAGATRSMMSSMLFSALFIFLPCWYLTAGLGNDGLWLAFTLFNLMRGVSLGLEFYAFSRHRRWLHWSAAP